MRPSSARGASVAAAVVAATMLVGLLASPVAAAGPAAGGGQPAVLYGVGPTGTQASPNWSGYVDDAPDGQTYSKVSASWVVPAVRCTSSTDLQRTAIWVGLDGYSDGSVEQDGTEAHCTDGVIIYATWWYMYPDRHGTGGAIRPGAHVSASVSFAAGQYTLSLTVAGNPGASFTTTQTCGDTSCADSSAEWIVEAQCCSTELPSGYYPMPDFGTALFRDASATSAATSGPITAFPDVALDIVNKAGTKDLAVVSPLLDGATAFKDTWKASG